MYNAVICRYHEIAIKGNNRSFFERKLVDNLRWLLRDCGDFQVLRVRGRIWIEHPNRRELTPDELKTIAAELSLRAFGVESFSPVILLKPTPEAITEAMARHADAIFAAPLAKAQADQTRLPFRIRARRSDKDFPLRSREIEIAMATWLGERYGDDKLKIDLDNEHAVTVGIEVRNEFAMFYFESFPAPGGLPVGSNDRVLALLSGGIDSPVACYLTMKRGAGVDFLAFHSSPYTPPETENKIQDMAAWLNTFQPRGRLFMGNLAEIQKLIRDRCNPRFRTVLYRRMMFRIAAMVAEAQHDRALLTGESLGQVASQTVINMGTINQAVNTLVIRPLVGMDKLETIRIAEKIGTFERSSVQVPDSCTVFAPSSPATAVTVDQALEEEARIPEYPAVLAKIVADILSPTP